MTKPPRSKGKGAPSNPIDSKSSAALIKATTVRAEAAEEGGHLVQVSRFAELLLIGESILQINHQSTLIDILLLMDR